ncbi:MAG TPA: uracil phosphoribosyltransferase [Paenibacillaceae bacterium]|nr:uracil phosphoribosyltransferase [Paenibacillaceae bacterium]
MGQVIIFDHPLIQHKMTILRDKKTGMKEFRELVYEISLLMAYEVTRDLPLQDVEIETPVAPSTGKVLANGLGIIPILRAGLGFVSGMQEVMPTAKVGHIGLYRNEETLEPVEYYVKLPSDFAQRVLVVVDPMLATGGSAAAAISLLKDRGAKKIKLMCLIGSPEGIQYIQDEHPDVDVYLGALDPKLNDHGYIVPGLGDAGDRLFGTN